MEYYSAIQKDKPESSVGKWVHLETTDIKWNKSEHQLKYCTVSLRSETQNINKE